MFGESLDQSLIAVRNYLFSPSPSSFKRFSDQRIHFGESTSVETTEYSLDRFLIQYVRFRAAIIHKY